MMDNESNDIVTAAQGILGLKCWHVSCGGVTLPTFALSLGAKIRRERPLRNTAQGEEFRQFAGEAELYVWSTWRLDTLDEVITSSDDSEKCIVAGLHQLLGADIDSLKLAPPGWDVTARFSNSLVLKVFCDHVPGDPSFDGNWEMTMPKYAINVGPGSKYDITRVLEDA